MNDFLSDKIHEMCRILNLKKEKVIKDALIKNGFPSDIDQIEKNAHRFRIEVFKGEESYFYDDTRLVTFISKPEIINRPGLEYKMETKISYY